jgi:hypothetical protein
MDVLSKMKRNLLQWGDELHAIKSDIIFERLMRAATKAGFDPAQPRDDQGRWTGNSASDSTREFSVAAKNAAECDFQYKLDTAMCNLMRTPLCWAQAAERYGACLAGRPLPQLRF